MVPFLCSWICAVFVIFSLQVLCQLQNSSFLPGISMQQASEITQGHSARTFFWAAKTLLQVGMCIVSVTVLNILHIATKSSTFPVSQDWVSSCLWCFPICWKGLSSLPCCLTDLLNSCLQGAHAETPPITVCHRPWDEHVPIITEAPLLNKGDTALEK